MPIPKPGAKDDADEKKVLSKLLVDEGETIRNLSEQVEKAKQVFRIENPSGRVIFQVDELSDRKRVAALLLGKYFGHRLGLIQDNSLGISEIARELGRPMTALSGDTRTLISDGFVEKLPIRKYRIVYHRIPAIIDMLTEKRKGEPKT